MRSAGEGNCLGLRFDERRALVLYGESGSWNVEPYLDNGGFETVSLEFQFLTATYPTIDDILSEKFSQIWIAGTNSSGLNRVQLDEEAVDLLYEYAQAGGGLVVLSDNCPFILGAYEVAERFGVGYSCDAVDTDVGLLSKADGTLIEHCVTRGIETLQGGSTPTDLTFPEGDARYALIARKSEDNLFLVFEDERSRVFFDAAFTRYFYWDSARHYGETDPSVQQLVDNITAYLMCECP